MQTTYARGREAPAANDELIDVLIAISVVAKRLATRLRQEQTEGGQTNEQDGRAGNAAR